MSNGRFAVIGLLLGFALTAQADVIDEKLAQYRTEGAQAFSAEAGLNLWISNHNGRSCTQCHGDSPQGVGKHIKTGKQIKPMAPSVNPQRFTDSDKIDKWFLRNCKWTLKRVCSAQEKGDILVWIREQ
ncbi:DUF1924 domain-containing protein [Amphritea sp. 1_MG-2023]|uniref:DUF1924 domain-containing protein n=1 Tax=Amphritea sp. 1_MG-2023 TaxID=3062670 RepID=UPI0026E30FC0|nr:DUF1924 domain-containing protein [Amphritea sp. 1_MG-2023]MDO6561857.1 DUF1924 domain-containing protein [Amphritea sp. 1_MG-2023]